jgi:hypothetical protein
LIEIKKVHRTKAAGSGGRAFALPHGTTKWTIKAAAKMRIRKQAAVSRMKLLPKGTPAGGSKLRPGPSKPGN